MNTTGLKKAVQHCLLYPGSMAFGFVTKDGVCIPITHAPLLPPMDQIFFNDFKDKNITAFYIADTSSNIPYNVATFAQKCGIENVFVVC